VAAVTLTRVSQPGAGSAYDLIRRRIVEGDYRPGERLVEQRVAEELDVSRTPVREAFRMLQAEGVVVVEPNRGARVRSLTAADVSDVYELRARLEAMAAELAAERATPGEHDELRAAEDAFAAAVSAIDLGDQPSIRAVFEANGSFHRAVLTAAHSDRLASALASTTDDGLVFQAFRHYDQANMERSVLFHRLVADAVRQGESSRAGRLMYEHVLQGKDRLLGLLADDAGVDRLYDSP
jgi:DNA-binding GntR family transcriptional regulator